MPGGFENSSMKTSFSLSSLQPSSVNLESPGQATLKDRPYSSLRKKPRRDPELDLWRRSWGSREENRDDCWNVLKQVNYQSLISDNNLIDSCQEASRDLLDGKIPSHEWNLSEFTDQFLELNEWLDRIQEAVYPRDAVMDKKIRLSHMEEMKRKDYKRKLFNNQGGRLVAREPGQKEEVAWRVVYLNSRWERLEAALSLRKRTSADSDICPDVDHELRGLRKWIKETEKRLTVLKIRHNDELSQRELEERSREEEIVRREVWSHGKIVRSLLRLCERLSCGEEGDGGSWVPRGRRVEREDVAKYAQGLEKRWQLLYLDCLELECAIQHKTSTLKQGSPLSANPVDSDEEPVKKHRRLADTPPTYQDNKLKDEDECLMDAEDYATPLNVDEVMEVEVNAQDAAATTQPLTDHQPTVQLRISDVSIIADDNLSPRPEMPITLDVIDDRKLYIDEIAKYTRSDCNGRVGTFYFMHKDTDTETDGGRGERGAASPDAAKTEESSEEEWTYTAQTESNNNEETNDHQPETVRPPKEMIKQLVKKAEKLVLHSPQRVHHKSFVEEWLLQYPEEKTVGDSCDASGEYTTEDDELESRICGSTDSFNQDLDTTLVPQGSSESLGTAHECSKVVMRAKKKEGRGQRPWSVSGASDAAFEQTQLPHSISESAIHEMSATAPCVKMDSSMHTGSTLSSSTVEDTTHTQEGSGGGYSSNSLRRRKIKLRKRTTAGRKKRIWFGRIVGSLRQQSPDDWLSRQTTFPQVLCSSAERRQDVGLSTQTLRASCGKPDELQLHFFRCRERRQRQDAQKNLGDAVVQDRTCSHVVGLRYGQKTRPSFQRQLLLRAGLG
uniref:Uncharacterized protein n=2 Tax=Lygus hesperus TaxID=30085 RepID=A0A0K8SH65_LYGHE